MRLIFTQEITAQRFVCIMDIITLDPAVVSQNIIFIPHPGRCNWDAIELSLSQCKSDIVLPPRRSALLVRFHISQ